VLLRRLSLLEHPLVAVVGCHFPYQPFAVVVDVVGHLEEELRLQALLLVGLLPGGALRVGGGRSSCALVVTARRREVAEPILPCQDPGRCTPR